MGLFDFLSRKDPTQDWPAVRAAPLGFDVVRGALNGIAFDTPFDALRVLGKPSNPKPVQSHLFAYAPLGLAVPLGATSEVLIFTCVFRAGAGAEVDGLPGFAPCRIALRNEHGTLLEVTSSTSVGEVEAALGPLAREGTDDGHVSSIVIDSVWLGFSFDHAGRLTLLDIEPAPDDAGEIAETSPPHKSRTMMTPAEFERAWGDDSMFPLIAYPDEIFEGTGISAENRRFLTEAGLPERAAPYLGFEPTEESLPELWDLPESFAKYTIIGNNGSGDPVVLTPAGSVMYLNHDDDMAEVYINKDVATLAEALLRFRNLILEAQRVGGEDAYLDHRIPVDLQRGFEAFLREADPRALEADSLWGGEVLAGWRT
jgi:hypothetical protein